MVYAVDDCVGRIRQVLEDTGLDRNTLLIFTTDHGIAMPRAKGTLYDAGVKTTLFMYKPGEFEGGRVYEEILSNVDLLPTILEYVGCDIPSCIQGRSFLGLINGKAKYVSNERVYHEMTWHDQYNPMRAIRTKKFKYIRNYEKLVEVYLPYDIYQGDASKELRKEFYGNLRAEEELYDLENDPFERQNLSNSSRYQDVLSTLRAELEKWMKETDDPLLKGPVPPTKEQKAFVGADNNPILIR